MKEDDPDHLMEFCEWFLHMCDERECFSGNTEHLRCLGKWLSIDTLYLLV
jgi:hypothetical protein